MPRRSTTDARRRRRSVAAAISGLAIGLVGVGAAAIPASAVPEAGDGSSAPTAPVVAGAPTGEHTVTLITGDRVRVTDLADGRHAVEVETAVPGAGFQTVTVGGEVNVIPTAAEPYLASGVVDPDLFNVTRLIEFGYDDASVDATPVIIELADGPTTFSAEPPVPGLAVGTPLESIGAAAGTAGHADAAATWAALTGTAPGAGATPRAFGVDPAGAELGGGIAAIHLDGKVQATLDSSVPWIGAPEAWAEGYTGTGVTVAVLDTGYDDTHPDLAGRVLPESTSFVPGEDVAWDPNGHGTHVASTIAGTGAASGGAHRGVADGANLLVGKVLDASGYGQDSWIIDAMEWAGQHAPIVSMSLGSMQPSDGQDLMAEALDGIAEQTGALFVVAAGNSGAPETIGSPGSAASALTVGSVDDPSGALSWFSSQGPLFRSGALKPDLTGPGNDVTAARSADYGGGEGSYLTMSGTSMATPHVAGAAAIVKQQHPEYTAVQLRAALTSTATDVDLSPYQAGAGVLDVADAVDASVVASGSGDFGMLAWGVAPEPVSRTIEYANRGDAEVTVQLEAALEDTTAGGGVEPLSAGEASDVLSTDAASLTIPAGETRSVTLTADPAKVPAGAQLSGALVASIDGEAVARTALGVIAEPERYDLTVTATGFDGEPVETYGVLYNHDTQEYGLVGVAGETTLRLLAGRYSVMSAMQLAREPDTMTAVLVGDPDVVLDGAASVAFDARAAKQVTVDVGQDGLAPIVRRMDVTADGYENGVLAPVWTDELWAQPMEAPNVEHFDFTTRWRLQEAPLTLSAGTERLDVIPQAGSVRFDGKLKARAVAVGTGGVDEFAAVDVRGKVAVVTRSDTVSPMERSANALAAGAAMLLVVNDADGELSEWVGGDDMSEVAVPVAAMSGVQGRRVLEALADSKGKLTISGTGVANADEIWDLARYEEGSIPEDLRYRPKDLARVDTRYHGEAGDALAEFRWDFAPNGKYGFGLPMPMGRGIERTEWVNADVDWYQDVTVLDVGWQVRDVLRSYEPGEHVETSYFGPIVRPYVGPGYWAPHRSGDFLQVNLPSWGDGGEPGHTGTFDVFAGYPGFSQVTDFYLDGEYVKSSPFQGVNVFGLPDGDAEARVVNTAVHDGTSLASSTRTVTEWTFTTTGAIDDYAVRIQPMLQAVYDVAPDASGTVGAGRKKGSPVALDLEIGHVAGASGSGAVTGSTLELRVAGGDWVAVPLEVVSSDDSGPGEPPSWIFPEGRAFVTAYRANLTVPDAGAWVDLRVTAEDSAGNSFSQEIERAFEVAPVKRGGK